MFNRIFPRELATVNEAIDTFMQIVSTEIRQIQWKNYIGFDLAK